MARKIMSTAIKAAGHDRRAAGHQPEKDKFREIAVDNPYQVGESIVVIASIRDDPLGRLHARGQIDEAQYQAGRAWQDDWERCEIGGVKAADPTKEPVDGGGAPREPVTDAGLKARKRLIAVSRMLGDYDNALVTDVLAKRFFIDQAAAARLLGTDRGIRYIGQRFRHCLELMAKYYQLA